MTFQPRVRVRLVPVATFAIVALLALGAGPASGSYPSTTGATVLGAMQWSFLTQGPVRSSPVVSGDRVLVASTDGSLYGLAIDSGRQLWRYEAGVSIVSTPTVAGARAYFMDRDNRIHAVDVGSGRRIWRRETGPDLPLNWGLEGWDYGMGSLVLAGDTLYVGSGDGAIYALRPTDGELIWRVQTGGRVRATPTVDGDTLYIGDADGVFHALDRATGRARWRLETDGHELDSESAGYDRRQIYSSAAVHDGSVYFGSRDAQVYALDATTGALRWQADDGTSAWVIAAPVVHAGRLLVTRSSSTRIRALALDTGDAVWSQRTGDLLFAPAVPMPRGILVAGGSGLLVAYDGDGEEQWRYGLGAGIWSAPAQSDGFLYVGSDDGAVRAFRLQDEPAPTLHVFADEDVAKNSSLGARPGHAAVVDYFAARGYQRLDAATLPAFMEARVVDGAPSVVVFAVDGANEAMADNGGVSLLRRFLEAGGRVVWLGHAPGVWDTDAEGRIVGLNRVRPGELLDVDHSNYNTDRYGVWPTAEGRRRGLRSWWMGGPRIVPSAGVEVLARDELGAAVAWTRNYGDAGGMFTSLYPSTDPRRLDEIRAVAEYGIFRSPAAQHHEAKPPE